MASLKRHVLIICAMGVLYVQIATMGKCRLKAVTLLVTNLTYIPHCISRFQSLPLFKKAKLESKRRLSIFR
jgi:hypothetical protein